MTDGTAIATHEATAPRTDGGAERVDGHRRRRPALSPSRAADFRTCPLLYRFRAVDRLPERPGRAQVRGTLVHGVLERLFDVPAPRRSPEAARDLVPEVWARLQEEAPALVEELFTGADDPELSTWLASTDELLESYFRLEDPRTVEPEARELRVEAELESGLLLRGYVDRLDRGPGAALTVVDYKTGAAPRPVVELRALFQLKFYALALWRARGEVPTRLRLLYLADAQVLTYGPDVEELARFARTLEAMWTAIRAAGATGDFRPNPGPACRSCDHRALCPAWDGVPPAYPGWPDDGGGVDTEGNEGGDAPEENPTSAPVRVVVSAVALATTAVRTAAGKAA